MKGILVGGVFKVHERWPHVGGIMEDGKIQFVVIEIQDMH